MLAPPTSHIDSSIDHWQHTQQWSSPLSVENRLYALYQVLHRYAASVRKNRCTAVHKCVREHMQGHLIRLNDPFGGSPVFCRALLVSFSHAHPLCFHLLRTSTLCPHRKIEEQPRQPELCAGEPFQATAAVRLRHDPRRVPECNVNAMKTSRVERKCVSCGLGWRAAHFKACRRIARRFHPK